MIFKSLTNTQFQSELIEKINEGNLSLFTVESSYGIQAIIVSESYLIT